MDEVVLGLDISTSCTGLTILDLSGHIVEVFALDFRNKRKFPTLFSKVEYTEKFLTMLSEKYQFRRIMIEEALTKFRRGRSKGSIISLLLRFNGILSWLIYKSTNITAEYVSATHARKKSNLKVLKGAKIKQVVLDHVLTLDPSFSSHIVHTRTGSVSPVSYDKADSYIIARYALLTMRKK